jgi:hypothetical protein
VRAREAKLEDVARVLIAGVAITDDWQCGVRGDELADDCRCRTPVAIARLDNQRDRE